MFDFFKDLFNSEIFMPHGHCFLWYPEILWLHVVSDVVITLAYFSISIAIFYIMYRQKDNLAFKWVYAMFASFILLCGLTHMLSIIVFWEPIYRFQGVLKAITSGVSIATAFLIIPIVPQILYIFSNLHNKNNNIKNSDDLNND